MKKDSLSQKHIPSFVWYIIAALLAVFEVLRRIFIGNECFIKQIFGFPCPSCGMTRALRSLLLFDLKSAFYYNPAFLTVPVAITSIILLALDKKRKKLWLTLFFASIGLLLLVWIIRLATGTAV